MTKTNKSKAIDSIFMGFLLQVDNLVVTKGSWRNATQKALSGQLEKYESYKSRDIEVEIQDDPVNLDLLEMNLLEDGNPFSSLSAMQAWDLTYHLRRMPGIVYAEPRFALILPKDAGCLVLFPLRNGSNNFDCSVEESNLASRELNRLNNLTSKIQNPEWHIDQMEVKGAWKQFQGKQGKGGAEKLPGEGVIVAHADSGYLLHPELDGILTEETRDEIWNEVTKQTSVISQRTRQALEDDNFPTFLWHGTATASLIANPQGREVKNTTEEGQDFFVTGVAPGAKIKACRVNTLGLGYEYFSPNLSHAINQVAAEVAAEMAKKKPDRSKVPSVLSISLGGYPSLAVRRAIINARKQGIIVVASAGNKVPFAVWPAAYDGVIAVASSSFNLSLARLNAGSQSLDKDLLSNNEEGGVRIAKHSSRGSRVNVSAPGELVCVAIATRDESQSPTEGTDIAKNLAYTVEPQSGTSYAAPLVAGLAALWLSYHGSDALITKYEVPAKIPLVFDKVLRETCYVPPGWETENWGRGIVNARRLLEVDLDHLPDPEDPDIQLPVEYIDISHVQLDRGGLDSFVHLFEQTISTPEFWKKISHKIYEQVESSLTKEIRVSPAEWLLGKFFQRSGKDLRQFLRVFGPEILFHFGTNLSLYQQVVNAINQVVDLSASSEDKDNFNDVRGALGRVSSRYLKENLYPLRITNR